MTSPTLQLTLWVCGIREGIGSARELAKKCERDEAYRWLEQAARKAAARDYLRRVDAAMGSRTSRGPFLVRRRHPRATVTIRGRLTQCVLQARRIDTS